MLRTTTAYVSDNIYLHQKEFISAIFTFLVERRRWVRTLPEYPGLIRTSSPRSEFVARLSVT